jgi:hypothetical protein
VLTAADFDAAIAFDHCIKARRMEAVKGNAAGRQGNFFS